MIKLTPARVFRETPSVKFHDISVPDSNGIDLVEHTGASISPPNRCGCKQWYLHFHQTDNNRCIKGHRLFELFYPGWKDPHWFVMLDENSGALEIPPRCYHRSYSGTDGSLLLNHAVRDERYDETQEFLPQIIYGHLIHPAKYHGCTKEEADHFIAFGTLPT